MSQDAKSRKDQETINNTSKQEKQLKPAFFPKIDDTTNGKQQNIEAKATTPSVSKSPESTSPITVNDAIDKKQSTTTDALKETTPLILNLNDKSSSNSCQQNYASIINPNNSNEKSSLEHSPTDLHIPKNNQSDPKWKCLLSFLPGFVVGTGTGLLFAQGKVNLAGLIILVTGIVITIAPICICFSCGSSKSDGNTLEDDSKSSETSLTTPING